MLEKIAELKSEINSHLDDGKDSKLIDEISKHTLDILLKFEPSDPHELGIDSKVDRVEFEKAKEGIYDEFLVLDQKRVEWLKSEIAKLVLMDKRIKSIRKEFG